MKNLRVRSRIEALCYGCNPDPATTIHLGSRVKFAGARVEVAFEALKQVLAGEEDLAHSKSIAMLGTAQNFPCNTGGTIQQFLAMNTC